MGYAQIEEEQGFSSRIRELVNQCFREAHKDRGKASELLLTKVKSVPNLWEQVLLEAIPLWCTRQIAEMIQVERVASIRAVPSFERGNGVRSLVSSNLMNFPMISGIYLRDALKAEVEANAKHYRTRADTEKKRADFLGLVARKLTDPKKPVKDQLTEADLGSLMRKVA